NVRENAVEALQRHACHVERSETSLIFHFHKLPKNQSEILRLARNENAAQRFNPSAHQRFIDYSFVRPVSAAESVSSSADSRPPPAGIPRAIRVRLTGLFFKRSTMKFVVDSPCTSEGSAKIIAVIFS